MTFIEFSFKSFFFYGRVSESFLNSAIPYPEHYLCFLSLFKPKLGILMGKSEALRVREYLFLNGMEQELEVLGGFSCGRVARVLNEAKAKNPGYDLWREQFLCGGAGSLVEGEGGKYLYCPSLTPGRDIFPRLLPSKRPEWLRDFMEGDMEKFRIKENAPPLQRAMEASSEAKWALRTPVAARPCCDMRYP